MKRIIPYIQYLWRISDGFRGTTLTRTIIGIVRVALALAFIWLSKTAIDLATGRVRAGDGELARWFGFMVACLLADVILSQWSRYVETRALMRMNNSLSRRLFNVLISMPLVNGRQGFHSGDMLNRLTLDVRNLSSFTLSEIPSMVVMIAQLVGSFLFLAWLNPFLALAPVVIMPVCLLASKLYFRRQRRLTAAIREGESEMHVSIQEGLKHRLVLKTLECIDVIDRRLGSIQHGLDSSNREKARLSAASSGLVRLGFVLGYLTAFGWSIFSLEAGVITFGTMSAFIQLVSRVQTPIAGLTGYIPSFISASVAIDRLREIDIELPEAQAPGEGRPMERAGVRVSDLTFRYEADSANVLTSFSHDFKPGSRTLIVGSTGAGKTTLIKLLLGLLKPDAGTIEIYGDGGVSREVSSATLRDFVYVPQGNSLLPGSIRDNLLLAAPDASDERLAEVLHIAAADFVFTLPQRLDTSCDEAGGGLSEGQAQRVAIARALLRPGAIMLLDEFNSALDVDTAATLMRRLSESCPDATIIIIAHHQSAIAPYCDAVLPIE